MKSLYFAGGFLFSQAGLLVLVVALVFCRVVSAVVWAGSVVLLYWYYLYLWGHCSVGMVMLAHPD